MIYTELASYAVSRISQVANGGLQRPFKGFSVFCEHEHEMSSQVNCKMEQTDLCGDNTISTKTV